MKLALRAFALLVLAVVTASFSAEAQQTGNVRRIGYLSLGPDTGEFRSRFTAFRDELRTLGYVEGKDIVIEQRHANGRLERLHELATALVALNVDVLVTFGSASAAQKVTSTIPIVFTVEPDPVGTGLVASLGRPGGNTTGLSDSHADLVPKRLELLKEVVPRAARVGFLLNPANHYAPPQLKTADAAGPALGLTVVPVEVKDPGREGIDRAFATIERERPVALVVVGDPTLGVHRTRIAELAIKQRLPTIGTTRSWAEGGLLMAYGADFTDLFRRAALYVDRILKGARPSDLPVEQPTKFDLVINLRTAKALGLTIPPSLLLRANDVIQ